MARQGLNIQKIHRIERASGHRILRATVANHVSPRHWMFITEDHEHCWYDPASGEWGWEADDEVVHSYPMCEWLFGNHPRPRDDSWGTYCSQGHWHVSGGGVTGSTFVFGVTGPTFFCGPVTDDGGHGA